MADFLKSILSKKYFFGWTNIKWFVRELVATFSNTPSHFSRKRIQSFFVFMSAIIGLNVWLYLHIYEIDYIAIMSIFAGQVAYDGYQIREIRKDILGKIGIVGKENENEKK